jgi:hypothetical protein
MAGKRREMAGKQRDNGGEKCGKTGLENGVGKWTGIRRREKRDEKKRCKTVVFKPWKWQTVTENIDCGD